MQCIIQKRRKSIGTIECSGNNSFYFLIFSIHIVKFYCMATLVYCRDYFFLIELRLCLAAYFGDVCVCVYDF
jgi:hypothetical protein